MFSAVTSVTVNGVATTLGAVDGNGERTFTTVSPVPVATNGAPTSVQATIAFANGPSMTAPLAVLEGYEIVAKHTRWENLDMGWTPGGNGCPCWAATAAGENPGGVTSSNSSSKTSFSGYLKGGGSTLYKFGNATQEWP
jgi:hypothetical protein